MLNFLWSLPTWTHSPILIGSGTGRPTGLCHIQDRTGGGCGESKGIFFILPCVTHQIPLWDYSDLSVKSLIQIQTACVRRRKREVRIRPKLQMLMPPSQAHSAHQLSLLTQKCHSALLLPSPISCAGLPQPA